MTDGADPERPGYQDKHTHGGMSVLRREALRHIPGIAGKDWRDVLGSDGLPDAERLRGK
jgi:hypothetical protein